MASPEKMFKLLIDEMHQSTALLSTVVQNQEIMIIQNKQLLELLEKLRVSATESSN